MVGVGRCGTLSVMGDGDGLARYLALYEVDAPSVINSPAWLAASEKGDWAPKIRPHTTNRSHTVMRKIS